MKISYLTFFSVVALFSFGSYQTLFIMDSVYPETTNVNTKTVPLAFTIPLHSSNGLETKVPSKKGREFQKENSDLSENFAFLREELSTLKRQIQYLQVASNKIHNNDDEDTSIVMRNDEVAMAEADEEYRIQMEAIENNFLREPSDQQWSLETHSVIEETLYAGEIPQSDLLQIECRSLTCRIEIASDGSGNLEKNMPLFIQQVGHILPNVRANHIDDGNEVKTVILYMSADTG